MKRIKSVRPGEGYGVRMSEALQLQNYIPFLSDAGLNPFGDWDDRSVTFPFRSSFLKMQMGERGEGERGGKGGGRWLESGEQRVCSISAS